MGSIGFYLHVLINASPPSTGGKPRSPPPQLPAAATATGPTAGRCLACACACPYKRASSPSFPSLCIYVYMCVFLPTHAHIPLSTSEHPDWRGTIAVFREFFCRSTFRQGVLRCYALFQRQPRRIGEWGWLSRKAEG